MNAITLPADQAAIIDDLKETLSAEEIVTIRTQYDLYAKEYPQLMAIPLITLMTALVVGYDRELTTTEKWREIYEQTQNNVHFFKDMPGRENEITYYEQIAKAEVIEQISRDFSLGIVADV